MSLVAGGGPSWVTAAIPPVSCDVGAPERSLTLTVEQAARYLGISRTTAYECVRTGSLPALRFGRRIVVPTVVIARLLASAADVDGAGQADA